MKKRAVLTILAQQQDKQRWLRAFGRIANGGASKERASFSLARKRPRMASASISSQTNIFSPPTQHAFGNSSYSFSNSIDVTSRYHSSESSTRTTTFRNPIHRNPSRISSSVGSIYRPPDYLLGIDSDPVILPDNDHVVADSIRSCIKIDEDDEIHGTDTANRKPNDKSLTTELSLCFLGTGAGSPANVRSTSCTLLKLSGANYLFDVGEGTQRQLQFAAGKGSSVQKIEKIFVTHLHGDHVFGLPGLLLSLQTSCIQSDESARAAMDENKKQKKNKKNKTAKAAMQQGFVVQIYGPPGLFNFIASAITLSCTRLHLLKVEVYELVGGRVRRISAVPQGGSGRHLPRGSPRQPQQQQVVRDPFRDDYPEFRYNGGRIQRFTIPCENGVWNIQDKPEPLSREEITGSVDRQSSGGGTILAKRNHQRLRIRAAEVDHMPGVATFGYVVEEDEPPRNLDVAKAKALGVSHKDKKYELLKHGYAVQADDGTNQWVEPQQVLKPTSKKARKVAIVGDNRGWTPQMYEIAQESDILVHEATLLEEDKGRGHSTASQAGRNAQKSNAKLLILNHISPKMESDMASVVREAYDACDRQLSVLMSFDFLEVLVPWMGFGAKPTSEVGEINKDDSK